MIYISYIYKLNYIFEMFLLETASKSVQQFFYVLSQSWSVAAELRYARSTLEVELSSTEK